MSTVIEWLKTVPGLHQLNELESRDRLCALSWTPFALVVEGKDKVLRARLTVFVSALSPSKVQRQQIYLWAIEWSVLITQWGHRETINWINYHSKVLINKCFSHLGHSAGNAMRVQQLV